MKQFLEYECREIPVCALFLSLQNELHPYFSYSLRRLPRVEKTPSATVAIPFEYKSLQIFRKSTELIIELYSLCQINCSREFFISPALTSLWRHCYTWLGIKMPKLFFKNTCARQTIHQKLLQEHYFSDVSVLNLSSLSDVQMNKYIQIIPAD